MQFTAPTNGVTWRVKCNPDVVEFVPGVRLFGAEATGSIDGMRVIADRLKVDGIPAPADYYVPRNCAPPAIDSLRGYQLDGVRRLVGNLQRDGGAILADDMGLGKSVQTLATWNCLRRPVPLLVICPASVRGTWQREVKKWVGEEPTVIDTGAKAKKVDARAKVVVTSYELAKKLGPQFTPHMLVMDEAHLLRGRQANRSQHLLELAKTSSYRLALTGTPMWSRPRDFWMLLKILFGYRFGTADQFDWAYCAAFVNQWGGKENKGASRLDELKRRLEYVMLRRTKEEVAHELPPMTRQIRWVPVTKEAKKATEAHALGQLSMIDALKATLTAKIDVAVETAEAAGRFLLFTWMKDHAHIMYDKLTEDGFEVELLTGDESPLEREATIARAQKRGASVVATIGSTNAGVDGLQRIADTAIFHHIDYTPIQVAQAEARLHRIGQKNPVTVIYIAMEDSADQFVVDTVIEKLDQWRGAMGDDATAKMNDTLSQQTAQHDRAALTAMYEEME